MTRISYSSFSQSNQVASQGPRSSTVAHAAIWDVVSKIREKKLWELIGKDKADSMKGRQTYLDRYSKDLKKETERILNEEQLIEEGRQQLLEDQRKKLETVSGPQDILPSRYDMLMEQFYIPQFGRHPYDVIKEMGLGSWRVSRTMREPYVDLAAHIEGFWRHSQADSLGVILLDEYKFLDSLSPDGMKTPWEYLSKADPEKGQPGYPRMFIENRAYYSRIFRKMHLELLALQNGVQILHCVMYPRFQYNMPIFACDMVGTPDNMSLACMDISSVDAQKKIPEIMEEAIQEVKQQHQLENNRELPAWATNILSKHAVCCRIGGDKEMEEKFVQICKDMLKMYLMYAMRCLKPVDEQKKEQIMAGHQRYCEEQKKNLKTRRMLETSFSSALADDYINKIIFDYPPSDLRTIPIAQGNTT